MNLTISWSSFCSTWLLVCCKSDVTPVSFSNKDVTWLVRFLPSFAASFYAFFTFSLAILSCSAAISPPHRSFINWFIFSFLLLYFETGLATFSSFNKKSNASDLLPVFCPGLYFGTLSSPSSTYSPTYDCLYSSSYSFYSSSSSSTSTPSSSLKSFFGDSNFSAISSIPSVLLYASAKIYCYV